MDKTTTSKNFPSVHKKVLLQIGPKESSLEFLRNFARLYTAPEEGKKAKNVCLLN